jgi:hypothetical protein
VGLPGGVARPAPPACAIPPTAQPREAMPFFCFLLVNQLPLISAHPPTPAVARRFSSSLPPLCFCPGEAEPSRGCARFACAHPDTGRRGGA